MFGYEKIKYQLIWARLSKVYLIISHEIYLPWDWLRRKYTYAPLILVAIFLINISQILPTFHKHDSNPFTPSTVAQIFPKIALGNELALALRGWNRESGVITLISKLCVLSPERYIRVPAPVGNAHGNIRTVL